MDDERILGYVTIGCASITLLFTLAASVTIKTKFKHLNQRFRISCFNQIIYSNIIFESTSFFLLLEEVLILYDQRTYHSYSYTYFKTFFELYIVNLTELANNIFLIIILTHFCKYNQINWQLKYHEKFVVVIVYGVSIIVCQVLQSVRKMFAIYRAGTLLHYQSEYFVKSALFKTFLFFIECMIEFCPILILIKLCYEVLLNFKSLREEEKLNSSWSIDKTRNFLALYYTLMTLSTLPSKIISSFFSFIQVLKPQLLPQKAYIVCQLFKYLSHTSVFIVVCVIGFKGMKN